MATKYAVVAKNLPKAGPKGEPSFLQKVEEHKREVKEQHPDILKPSSLAAEYASLKDEKDVLEAQESDLNVRMEAIKQLLIDQMEAEDVTGVRLDGGILVSIYPEPEPQVTDKEAYRVWCDADPDLRLKMQLWPTTTASIVKERLLAGEGLPPGLGAAVITKVKVTGR